MISTNSLGSPKYVLKLYKLTHFNGQLVMGWLWPGCRDQFLWKWLHPSNANVHPSEWCRDSGSLNLTQSLCLRFLFRGINSFYFKLLLASRSLFWLVNTLKIVLPPYKIVFNLLPLPCHLETCGGWYDNDVDLSGVLELSWLISLHID